MASRPLEANYVEIAMIKNTVSLSWRIGRVIALARKQSSLSRIGSILVDAVGGPSSAKVLFMGKITDVRRRSVLFYSFLLQALICLSVYKGHTVGEVVITALTMEDEVEDDPDYPKEQFDGKLTIPFKNENLYAEHTADDGRTIVRACSFVLESLLKVQR